MPLGPTSRQPYEHGLAVHVDVEASNVTWLPVVGLDGSTEDKGWDAVVAALDTAIVLRSVREPGARDGAYGGAGRPRH